MEKPAPMGTKTSHPVAFRVSKPHRQGIERAAKRLKMRVSDWLREVTAKAAGL